MRGAEGIVAPVLLKPLSISPCQLVPFFSLYPHIWESMADQRSTAQTRLGQVKDFLTMNKTATIIPFDPDSTKFPKRKDVPQPTYAPPGLQTAWVWGENDMVGTQVPSKARTLISTQIGRLNLLTPARVKTAASSEIKSGEMVPIKYEYTSSVLAVC